MGEANTQSIEVKGIKSMRNSLSGTTPPPLGHPPIAMVPYYPILVPSLIAPRPPRGTHWRKRGAIMTPETGFLLTKKYEIVPVLGADY